MSRFIPLFLIFSLFFTSGPAPAGQPRSILVVGDESYAPFEYRDDAGGPRGITVDIWRLWSKKTGVAVEYQCLNWDQALKMVLDGRADVVGGLFHTPEREKVFDFSPPYYEIHTHIFFDQYIFGLRDLEDLKGFQIGVVKADSSEELLRTQGFGESIQTYPSNEQLVKAALDHKLHVFVADTPVALYYLSKFGQEDAFKLSRRPLHTNKMFAGVKKGRSDLLNLVKTGFAAISEREIKEIAENWTGVALVSRVPWEWLAGLTAAGLAVLGLIILWNHQLRSKVKAATADLEEKTRQLDLELTERKMAQAALAAGEQRFERLIETMTDGLDILDSKGIITYVNRSLSRMLGYEPEEMIGRPCRDFLDEESRRILDRELVKRRAGMADPYELVWTLKNGSKVTTIVAPSPLMDARGGYQGSFGVITDITTRKEAEEALKRSEERYRELFNNISDLILTHDLRGRLLTVNRAAAQALGLPAEDLAGRKLIEFLPEDQREFFWNVYLDRLQNQGQAEGRFVLAGPEGRRSHIEYRGTLVKTTGREGYASLSGRDVTERILAEGQLAFIQTQLAQSQKMEAVGTLASGIAHDFNNILQAISGYVQLLLTKGEMENDARKHLHEVDQAAQRAAELVRQLLTYSRKARPELKPLDLNQSIRQAVALLERVLPRMIEIETDLAGDLSLIEGDPGQIEQMLMNLGANARDAMPEGGRLAIKTNNVWLDEGLSESFPDPRPGPYVRLSVSDTGLGMDGETLEHLFEPFFTTKKVGQGTGLGLSSVYGIVKNHWGHITCSSRPGQGAVFTIHLPALIGAAAGPSAEPRDIESLPGGRETILLVDDEKAILEIASDLFLSQGYRILTARSGEQALEIYQAQGGIVDLIILDVGMPGMSGLVCLKELIKMNPAAKVIVSSGYAADVQTRAALAAGAKGFIAKPYRLTDLAKAVRTVLDGGSLG
ncbi:MAG: PAS domain S-box protein [Thermodesulfobacteriota bacterium]